MIFVDRLNHLLSKGFNLRCVDNHGQSLLDWAAVFGKWKMVEMLCSRCETKATFDLTAALAHAVAYGQRTACATVLKHGADINAVAMDGLRAIERAEQLMAHRYEEIVRLLKGMLFPCDESLQLQIHLL